MQKKVSIHATLVINLNGKVIFTHVLVISIGLIGTVWQVSKYGVLSVPNRQKYGPEKSPYLDTFHAVRELTFPLGKFLLYCSI